MDATATSVKRYTATVRVQLNANRLQIAVDTFARFVTRESSVYAFVPFGRL